MRNKFVRLREWGCGWFSGWRCPRTEARQTLSNFAGDYSAWRASWIARRRQLYPAPANVVTFSILSAVHNPPPAYLSALARSVLQQDYPHFEWVVVDNGCNAATQRHLTELTRDPRVLLVPAGTNRGIVGGLRLALRAARGQYVLPVDHDDELTPDALRVVASALTAMGLPKLAYTDEDKLLPDGTPALPFFKPDWDPLLFLNCCYTAHLGVLDRQAALAAGVYADEQAMGSPDWDAFARLIAAGHLPRHIPEVVYSWRMHADSTAAGGAATKPYTVAGQFHVLKQHLGRLGLDKHLTIRANPLYGEVGLWRAAPVKRRRRRRDELAVLERAVDDDSFRLAVEHLPPASLVVIKAHDAMPVTQDWFEEPLALLDAFPQAVAVGGCLVDLRDRILAGPGYFGMDGLVGWPGRGASLGDRLGAGILIHQHAASVVDDRFVVVRGEFLKEMVTEAGGDFAISLLGPWLGATARKLGRLVLFSPHLVVAAGKTRLPRPSADQIWRFLRHHWPLLLNDPTYCRFYQLDSRRAFELASPAERAAVLNRSLSQLAGVLPYFELLQVSDHDYPTPVWTTPDLPDHQKRSAA